MHSHEAEGSHTASATYSHDSSHSDSPPEKLQEELEKEKSCNIDNGAGYIRNPCYRDTEDKTTLELWVIHREKNETETNEVEDDESKEDDSTNFFDNMA